MAIKTSRITISIALALFTAQAFAQVNFDAMLERGEALYKSPASCAVCHKESGEGLIGPDIRFGYASHRSTGMAGAQNIYRGVITTMKPFWVANKGEHTGHLGRTVSAINPAEGKTLDY